MFFILNTSAYVNLTTLHIKFIKAYIKLIRIIEVLAENTRTVECLQPSGALLFPIYKEDQNARV